MNFHWLKTWALAAAFALALAPLAGCDGDEDEDDSDRAALAAVMVILHLDTEPDGVPDLYRFLVRASGPADHVAFDSDLTVRLPSGTILPTTCAADGPNLVCETTPQTAPVPGDKTSIPAGTYIVLSGGSNWRDFTVLAAELNPALDPAPTDPASLDPAPAAAGTLADPATLAWDPTAPAPAGNYWEYAVTNADGADDDGQTAAGRTLDYASANLNHDLPDAWDNTDPLEITLTSVVVVSRGLYTQVVENQSIVTGYTLAK